VDKIDYMFLASIIGSLFLGTILTYAFSVGLPSTGTFVGAIEFVKDVIEWAGYVGIFILAFLEIIYPAIPGELVLPFVGFLVAEKKLNLMFSVLAATTGNVLGMLTIYVVSMKLGRPFIDRYGKYFLLDKRHIEMSEELFNKYGEIVVLIGRMLPGYRELISVPAGLGRMKITKFILFTFIGSFLWVFFLVFIGLKLGENYVLVKTWFDRLDIFVWASIILAIVWFVVKGRLREPAHSE